MYARHEAMAVLAQLAVAQGDLDLAWAQVREVLPDGPATAPGGAVFHVARQLQHVAVDLTLAGGDPDAAAAWLAAIDRWLAWSGAVAGRAALHLGRARLHHLTEQPLAGLGETDRAIGLAQRPRQPVWLLIAHRVAGELAIDLNRRADAERNVAEALAIAEACGARFERALTMLTMARLRAAAGRPDDALRLLADASAVLSALSAGPALARAETLRETLTASPEPASILAGLTAREREVLRLVARGMTDAEIGVALSISYRTVSQHLRSVYGKLGVSSRAAATRIAVEHRLL
jgi:ATP/maltotriose-dependent transcriptional regulator MalT